MRCIAIDDEPLALDVIKAYCNKIPEIELAGTFTNPLEALELLKKEKIDLIFLDIQMPGLTGIQFIKTLTNPPLIIFTTAYENFALQGYELDVVDYLLKPIPFDRFTKSVNKAIEVNSLLQLKEQQDKPKEFIFIRSEYQLVKVNYSDILYIEGLKDYVKIFAGPKPIFSHQNLKSIESKLPADDFVRVHKSYIVSVRKIVSIQKSIINLNGIEIPIGDSYKDQVLNLWKN